MKPLLKTILLLALVIGTGLDAYPGPRFFQRRLPGELVRRSLRIHRNNPSVLDRFKMGGIYMRRGRGRRFGIRLKGARPLSMSGMPQVPQFTKQYAVDPQKNAEASLENVVVEETSESIPIETSPEAFVWRHKKRIKFKPIATERYFPGSLVQSYQRKNILYVSFFPIQVDLHTGKILKVVSADIHLSYSDKVLEMGKKENAEAPSLILTSEKLKGAAEILKKFHESNLGIKTSIVTVEEIEQSEIAISESLLPPGYKDQDQRDNFVKPYDEKSKTGYRYETAKKISNYLQKRMGETSLLKYVTVLGDSTQVPPSYYFAYYVEVSRNFTPTDACYGAIQQCGDPKVAVGRLPLQSETEVKNYIAKVNAWEKFATESTDELALYGGKAFPQAEVYVGELGALNTIQDVRLDWRGVQKFFKTKGSYTRQKMEELVEGNAPTPFAYHLDHGNGNEWYIEKDYLTSAEILKNKATQSRPSLMVSISCSNAAFDEAITNEEVFEDKAHGELSIGTSLISSPGGAVAYLGAARPAIGMPLYQFDDFGNVELNGANYGLQILESFYKKYGLSRAGRLGDFSLKALQAFVSEYGNDMNADQNLWSYFITELLGDPVIPLPQRTKQEESFETGKSNLKLDNSLGFGLPVLKLADLVEKNIPLIIPNSVEATLFKIQESEFGGYEGEQQLISQLVDNFEQPELVLENKINLSEGKYFLRIENTRGVPRERQVYFNVE